ncbi:MAG: mannitol-1-phosphate 5-dehydrogenase [Chloroflexi bacterium]|nr:mannitol-1-phosphate 5-dehydrogenase [Chloroflexota bacterium]
MDNGVIFGAGAIGRGFMGQLFTASGYAVTFVDIDASLIATINQRGAYTLTLVDASGSRDAQVSPVKGLLSTDSDAVTAELATATLGATAVGTRALAEIAPLIARGVRRRMDAGVQVPLNILVCENIPQAAGTLRALVESHLTAEAQVYARQHLGLADVVIGRMVPEPTREMRARDLSAIVAEPYAELPVDRAGLIGEPPRIMGMHAVQPFSPWIARKLFLHNAVHALMGYLGYRRGLQYGYEALEDPIVRPVLAAAMGEAEAGLAAVHGFDVGDLMGHVARLWPRLANRALADPVRRLARDPLRKLASDDRLVGPARCAEKAGVSPDGLAWGIAGALSYDAAGDSAAMEIQRRIAEEGVEAVLQSVSGIAPKEPLGGLVLERYALLREGEWLA